MVSLLGFIYLDPLYFIILAPALLLMMIAQGWIQSAFSEYSEVHLSSGLSGAEVAEAILKANGIQDVTVEVTEGFLSDHYDPTSKALRLSPDVYHGVSAASVAVAAHEVGHAIQHACGYFPLYIRSALVPLVQFGSFLWFPLFLGGAFLQMASLVWLGILAFSATVAFQLVTLPVEFDASRRALAEIERLGLAQGEEIIMAKKLLTAAALTYVAAALQSILTLIYFLIRAGVLGGDED